MLSIGAFVLALSLATAASAQVFNFGTSLSLTTNPRDPGPEELVVVTAEHFGEDLNNSTISWFLNGVLEQSARGAKTFRFTTGKLGDRDVLSVVAITPEGKRLEKNLAIHPAEIDIIWSANTYTPPFYKGKALPSSKSSIRLAALPHFITQAGTRLDPRTLNYKWELDRRVLGSVSGAGKQTLSIAAPRGEQSILISVEVSSTDGRFTARESITITSNQARLIFYEKHPTEGVYYGQTLSDGSIFSEQETTIRAEPYFFSLEDILAGELEFEWTVNNRDIETPENPFELVVRREEGERTARIGLTIENAKKILQVARETISVNLAEPNRLAP